MICGRLEFSEDFRSTSSRNTLVDGVADIVAYEAYRAITQRELSSARVVAPKDVGLDSVVAEWLRWIEETGSGRQ